MTRKSERELERDLDRLHSTDDAPARGPMILFEDPETGVRRDADGGGVDEADAEPLMIIIGEPDDHDREDDR